MKASSNSEIMKQDKYVAKHTPHYQSSTAWTGIVEKIYIFCTHTRKTSLIIINVYLYCSPPRH